MSPERWEKVKELFDAALQCEPGERRRFLDQACGDDIELKEELVSLLASYEEAGSFIAAGAIEDAAHLLVDSAPETRLGSFIDRYRLLAPLGRGGMGEVYLATDTRLGREVALKLLPAEFANDSERVKRFEREARIASALNHPNILTIYEIGRDGEAFFISSEFVKGRTLRRRLADGAINTTEAVEIAIQVASALEAAHDAGIVHRDIKPENVMLRPDNYVKVLDFGLAKPIGAALAPAEHSSIPTCDSYETAPGALIGTFRYMSPEQARGQNVDCRSDLWSLGAVFHEMLAGVAPFEGETPSDIIAAILTREPQPIIKPGYPESQDIQNIVARALAKERERRYGSAPEMLSDLRELRRKLERRFESKTSAVNGMARATAAVTTPEARRAEEGIRRKTPWMAPAALLSILAISLSLAAFVSSMRTSSSPFAANPAPPERAISYSITVQKMRNGKPLGEPFGASGQEVFESGWRFRLRIVSLQGGYLYLLNEGPASDGAGNYRIIFPIYSIDQGSARIAANEPVLTDWYVFTDRPGVEKLWIVWTAFPAQPLEAIKEKANPIDQGVIDDTAHRRSISEWLARHAAGGIRMEKSGDARRTVVRGRGDVLAGLIKLEHGPARPVGLSDPNRDKFALCRLGRATYATLF